MSSTNPPMRATFKHFYPITSRWMDNDVYGHINNVQYYAFFDSAVNRFLIEQGGLNIHSSPVIAYVVSSGCEYKKPICYPDSIEIGLGVSQLGNSSVTYQLGAFRTAEDELCALGSFTHVFVDRQSQRPTPIPEEIRQALSRLHLALGEFN